MPGNAMCRSTVMLPEPVRLNAYEPTGTACGDPTDTDCDHPDECNTNGECAPNYVATTVLCRVDAGACDIPEYCDGFGECPVNSFESAGTACGSNSDSVCDNPDNCDASGNCLVNHEPTTTRCREDAGDCDVPEYCDTAGLCPANGFEPAGTSCGDPSDTVCDNPDTCSGTGLTCNENADTAACTPTDGEILPTQTTCQMYKDNSVTPYDALYYNAKAKVIISVAPGVIYYYSTIVAPSAEFDIIIQQSNTGNWADMLSQNEGNNPAVYSYADCAFANFGAPERLGDTIIVHVSDAVPGERYIVGTKYSPQALVGTNLNSLPPTSDYLFNTVIEVLDVDVFSGAGADIWVRPKEKTGGGKPPKPTVYISIQ